MKFLITCPKERLASMKSDLDAERAKLDRIRSGGRFKAVSDLFMRVMGMPMAVVLDYRDVPGGIEVIVNMTGAGNYLDAALLERDIRKRAKDYGSDVSVKVMP